MKSPCKQPVVPQWNPMSAKDRFALARLRWAKQHGRQFDPARLADLERRSSARKP